MLCAVCWVGVIGFIEDLDVTVSVCKTDVVLLPSRPFKHSHRGSSCSPGVQHLMTFMSRSLI